jgi:hypothetical protein
VAEPRQIEQTDGVELVEHCARFASQWGIDHMLDLIAGVHQAYAPLSASTAVKAAYEIASIDLAPDAKPFQ